MSEEARFVESLRLLGCEFAIHTNSPEILELLRSVAPHAAQAMPITHRHTLRVTWTGEEFRVSGIGEDDDFELSPTRLVERIVNEMNTRAIDTLSEHIRLRAASGTDRGRGFLIAGPQQSGKTVLALRLLLDGLDIVGDELVLLRDRSALPFPRKFLIGEASLPLLPDLAGLARFAPFARNPQAERLLALDPQELGRQWRIAPAPVTAVFYLEPSFGARTTLRRSTKIEMLRRLIPQTGPPASRRRNWLADLTATVDQADAFVVAIGDLASASAAIRDALR